MKLSTKLRDTTVFSKPSRYITGSDRDMQADAERAHALVEAMEQYSINGWVLTKDVIDFAQFLMEQWGWADERCNRNNPCPPNP